MQKQSGYTNFSDPSDLEEINTHINCHKIWDNQQMLIFHSVAGLATTATTTTTPTPIPHAAAAASTVTTTT
jgi:kynurenine formamidase